LAQSDIITGLNVSDNWYNYYECGLYLFYV